MEALLEDARIKLSSCVSDLLGVSSRRMLYGLARGEKDPAVLAGLADPGLRASAEQLQDALSAAATMSSLHRELLGLFLARLELIEKQIEALDAILPRRYTGMRAPCNGWPRCRASESTQPNR